MFNWFYKMISSFKEVFFFLVFSFFFLLNSVFCALHCSHSIKVHLGVEMKKKTVENTSRMRELCFGVCTLFCFHAVLSGSWKLYKKSCYLETMFSRPGKVMENKQYLNFWKSYRFLKNIFFINHVGFNNANHSSFKCCACV